MLLIPSQKLPPADTKNITKKPVSDETETEKQEHDFDYDHPIYPTPDRRPQKK